MDNLTVADVAGTLALVAGILTAGGTVVHFFQKAIKKTMNDELKPIQESIIGLQAQIQDGELEDCKTVLVNFIGDIKRGVKLSGEELERLHETYDRYTKMGGNSYIHTSIEKFKKEGKI